MTGREVVKTLFIGIACSPDERNRYIAMFTPRCPLLCVDRTQVLVAVARNFGSRIFRHGVHSSRDRGCSLSVVPPGGPNGLDDPPRLRSSGQRGIFGQVHLVLQGPYRHSGDAGELPPCVHGEGVVLRKLLFTLAPLNVTITPHGSYY